MSRQQKRKEKRDLSKKVGKLKATYKTLSEGNLRGPARAIAFKNLFRLQSELMDAGVIKRPNMFKRAWGSIKATARVLWR